MVTLYTRLPTVLPPLPPVGQSDSNLRLRLHSVRFTNTLSSYLARMVTQYSKLPTVLPPLPHVGQSDSNLRKSPFDLIEDRLCRKRR